MLSSLQCGLALVPPDADAAMFLPVDHPHIALVRSKRWPRDSAADRAPVTVPIYAGEHGHPVCIARPVIDELLALATATPKPATSFIATSRKPSTSKSPTRPWSPTLTIPRLMPNYSPGSDTARMKKRSGAGSCSLLLLVVAVGLAAPSVSANRFRPRIQAALEAALNRPVHLGAVHLNLFTGPGFTVDDVLIDDDPAAGIEPFAHVESHAGAHPLDQLVLRQSRVLQSCVSDYIPASMW